MALDFIPDETLDCRDLYCPVPILKTTEALGKMKSGQILEILSTEPETKNDLPVFASRFGHEYLGNIDEEDFTRSYIMVK